MDNNINFYQTNMNNQIDFSYQNIIFYPNPTQDIVHLSILDKDNDIRLYVYDIMGKELFRQVINDSACHVDLSSFNSGIFFFKITYSNYNKIIKIIKI